MSINSFTYNGVSSENLGLYVGGQQTFGSPQRDVTKVSIPGRNGDLVRDNGRFLNAQIAYNVVAMSDFKDKTKSVRNWLMSARGYKRLEDTYHPEHYRMAMVADSVDFETGAFNATGKAKIIFDCMPQRFLKSGETVVSGDPVERSASGEIASFETDYVVPLTSAEVSLSPIQSINGYGSPWPAGGGKNKYPNSDISNTLDGITVTHNSADESYKVSGLSTAYRGFVASSTFTLKAGAYVLSRTASSSSVGENNLRMEIRSADGLTTYASSYANGGVFTLAEDTEVKARIVVGQSGVDFGTGITYRFQIESGSTATAWTPYSNICPISGHAGAALYVSPTTSSADATTYPVTFSDQGTVYGGTFDFVTGDGEITMLSYDLAGRTWTMETIGDNTVFSCNAISTKALNYNFLCNKYKNAGTYRSNLQNGECGCFNNSSGRNRISICDNAYSTVADFVASIADIQVVYELATPTTFTLSPQQIETLLGENNVWSDAGEISLTFYEPAELDNPTPFDSKPLIRAYGSGNGQVTIGNQIIALTDINGYIDIDCEAMDCYNGVENCNSKVTLGTQGFPTLPPGITAVSFGGGVTRVEITPRWWEV